MSWVLYNLTSTTQSGGVETSVWRLATELAALGREVTVHGGEPRGFAHPRPEGVAVETFAFTPRERFPRLGSRFRKFMERVSMARQAWPALAARRPRHVLCFKPYDLPLALAARKWLGARVGYLSGGTEFYPGFGPLARRLDYLASVSRFNAGQVEAACGRAPQVNYLGVDRGVFHPAPPDPELAGRAGLEGGRPALVAAVRLVASKGLRQALEALGSLGDEVGRPLLVVAGDGPQAPELTRRAADLGLADRLVLLGRLPQARLAGFYALGRVAVFPSHGEEALGLSIAEAMACGLPVVASDLGGVPEVVGDCGLLAPPRDVPALAAALTRLLTEPALAAELGRRGRARVAELLDWRATARRLVEGMEGGEGA